MTASKAMWPTAGPPTRRFIGMPLDEEIPRDNYVGESADDELESKTIITDRYAVGGIIEEETTTYVRFESFAASEWGVSPSTLFKVHHKIGFETFIEFYDDTFLRVPSNVLIEVEVTL